jgi:saccharopine dehydrogenase-like NADP-dependent oxidoreductase
MRAKGSNIWASARAQAVPTPSHSESAPMRILLVGAGGVGSAVAAIAARRDFFQLMVVADHSHDRARRAVSGLDRRFLAARLDAASARDVAKLCRAHRITHVLNAVDPRFVMPVFDGALQAGADYLDLAMSLSDWRRNVMLGDEQFAQAVRWAAAGRLALTGIGVEPGLSDVFARYAADHLFSEIDEIGVRDGSNITIDGFEFAPSFSIWTTIEECLNPPVIWERGRGWFTTEPFSEPETFDFPEGIGPIECVNVEHEEVLLIPRWVDAKRVTFKYGLGAEFIEVLKTVQKLGLDSTQPLVVGAGARSVTVSPRDVLAARLPDPATLGTRMRGKTCAGTWVRGTGVDGQPREVYLYHVVDNEWSMRTYGHQAVVWQTAVNPVVALELLALGAWEGVGVLGPEAFDAKPFLDLLCEYGSPWRMREDYAAHGGVKGSAPGVTA